MTRPRDNRASLLRTRLAGRIAPPRAHPEALRHDHEGRAVFLPGTGGIAPGVHAGDPVEAWLADHLLPGASLEDEGDPAVPGPLHLLACLGNPVQDAAGRLVGVVAGKRGGLAPGAWAPQLVGVELAPEAEARLVPGDRMVVEASGRGLAFEGLPVTILNLSPRALDALPLRLEGEALACEVVALVPPEAAGAGLGQDGWVGDLEIADPRVLAGTLAGLRFGDLVAFQDIDAATTRHYRPGHVSIGVVSHGPSPAPGHGVGVTLLLTGPATALRPAIVPGPGLGELLRGWAAGP